MIIIQSISDFNELHNPSFADPLMPFLKEMFYGLCAEVDEDNLADHLNHNPIFICQVGDQLLQRFSEAPSGPEYVERINLQGFTLYRVGVLLDNDWIAQYLVPVGLLDKETEGWLAESSNAAGGFL